MNQSLLLSAFVFRHMHSIYISQLSHVAMFPPRKKMCRSALSPSLRVLIVCVTRNHQLQSVPAAIGLCVLATCTAYIYISQPSHVAMFPPRKKVCRIALSLSLRVFILGVNIPQKPSATRLTEMRTKALLLKLRGDSLST